MRVVFLGSPPFATPILERLIASPHTPVAVVTAPERSRGRGRKSAASPVAELAESAGLPLLRPESARSPEFLAELAALEPDLCLVASYGELLTQDFLDLPPRGTLNVHGSLLPRHRGASPVQAALLAGDPVTGVAIQRVVLALDAGDVLLTRELEIGAQETAGELFERLSQLGAEAAVEALDRVAAGEDAYTPQDPAGVTVCRKLKKADGAIDWARSAAELERFARAMNPWPAARTRLPDGRGLSVLRARLDESSGAPGEVLEAGASFRVACGEGALELIEVQVEGKRALPAADFLRGARLEVGARLGANEES